MWPDYVGLNPEPVRSLATQTFSWPDSVEIALAEVHAAENLIGEPTGVTDTLRHVGTEGRAMGTAMHKAIDKTLAFNVKTTSAPTWSIAVKSIASTRATTTAASWTAFTGRWIDPAAGRSNPPPPPPRLDMVQVDRAVDKLAAEVQRLSGLYAHDDPTPRQEFVSEQLRAIGRRVTVDESEQLGRATDTWVHREIASTAHEWNTNYVDAGLLHRRSQILQEEPTEPLRLEMTTIGQILAHRWYQSQAAEMDGDELVTHIRSSTQSGRDPNPLAHSQLREIFFDEIGDADSAEAALVLALRGIPFDEAISLATPSQIGEVYDAIAHAMVQGDSPADAGLASDLFPTEYRLWHELAGYLGSRRAARRFDR